MSAVTGLQHHHSLGLNMVESGDGRMGKFRGKSLDWHFCWEPELIWELSDPTGRSLSGSSRDTWGML